MYLCIYIYTHLYKRNVTDWFILARLEPLDRGSGVKFGLLQIAI